MAPHSNRVGIVHLIPEFSPGGAQRIVLRLAAASIAGGHDVLVASSGGEWVDLLQKAGATHVRLPLNSRRLTGNAVSAAQLTSLLRRHHPRIVHAHNPRAGLIARAASALCPEGARPALVVTAHGGGGMSPRSRHITAAVLRALCVPVVACGTEGRDQLVLSGFPSSHLRLIPNGSEPGMPDPAQVAHFRSTLRLGDGPIAVGIGRLVPQKNWELLVEVAERLPWIEFVVAGDGPLRDVLRRKSGGNIQFIGHTDAVASLLDLADCLVMPSLFEGVPLALLEAFSLSVPAVVSPIKALANLVDGAGVVSRSFDPDAFAFAVVDALRDPVRFSDMRSRARDIARRMTQRSMELAYLDLYDSLYRRVSTATI